MFSNIILQLKLDTCFLDPSPHFVFLIFYSILGDDVLNIVNYSVQTGMFPETALVRVLNDLRTNLDMKKLLVLVLLELPAAFDTV